MEGKGRSIAPQGEVILPVKIRNGTPILPNETCLELIEEIERAKKMQIKTAKTEDEYRNESIWPQLKNAINWLLKNQFERAVELMQMVICRRTVEK